MNLRVGLVTLFAALFMAGVASAQVPHAPDPGTAASTGQVSGPAPAASVGTMAPDGAGHALTASDLGTFFDGLVPFALERGDVAGGVIAVVKDGKILFAKGYGYANLKTHARPSPARTLFRIGSTSKLFTWTAVMQLVGQGKLDLDVDINRYLDFTIPPRDGKPITLRDLMTMTPGFEDTARDLMPASVADVNLGRYLKTHVPARIFPPGKIVAYSNYGAGLAGYIVQRVSGEPFADYVRQHIFAPLGMRHSSFAQPLPPALAPLMAKGYKSASDARPQPFELVDPAPAGAMSTTALDMARFMIAQLQEGRYDDVRILPQALARRMHSPQYTAAPGLNGYDLGFYQENRNGQRIIGHAGDTVVFHSDLHLLLDADVGIFMSFNSAGNKGGAEQIRTAIFRAFLDRYFTHAPPALPTLPTAGTDAARVTGWYETSRRNESALRLLYLLGQTRVTAQADGTLSVSMPMLVDAAGKPLHWRETGPLRYTEVKHGKSHLVFVTDKRGEIRYWATDEFIPVMVFQRVPAATSKGVVVPLVELATLIALVTLLIWLAGWLLRRHYRKPLSLARGQRRTRALSRLGALAIVVLVLGWLVFLATMGGHPTLLLDGAAVAWLRVLHVLGVLALLGALAILVHALCVWRAPRRSRWVRAGEILLALAALYSVWFIVMFGLVSFNVGY